MIYVRAYVGTKDPFSIMNLRMYIIVFVCVTSQIETLETDAHRGQFRFSGSLKNRNFLFYYNRQ